MRDTMAEELMTFFFSRLPLLYVFICVTLLVIISIVFVAFLTKRLLYDPHNLKLRFGCGMMFASFILASLLMTASVNTLTTAYHHGFDTENIAKTSTADLWDDIHHSFVEDEVPDDVSGCLIVYYKLGCPDCEAIYDDLKTRLEGRKNVYRVATRSKQGKALREQYPVPEVPSGVYVTKDGTPVIEVLYKTKNGKTTIDEEGLTLLLKLLDDQS